MDIDRKLTEILTSTLVIENKKGIPFAIAKLREFIEQKQSNEEAVKDDQAECTCNRHEELWKHYCPIHSDPGHPQ